MRAGIVFSEAQRESLDQDVPTGRSPIFSSSISGPTCFRFQRGGHRDHCRRRAPSARDVADAASTRPESAVAPQNGRRTVGVSEADHDRRFLHSDLRGADGDRVPVGSLGHSCDWRGRRVSTATASRTLGSTALSPECWARSSRCSCSTGATTAPTLASCSRSLRCRPPAFSRADWSSLSSSPSSIPAISHAGSAHLGCIRAGHRARARDRAFGMFFRGVLLGIADRHALGGHVHQPRGKQDVRHAVRRAAAPDSAL